MDRAYHDRKMLKWLPFEALEPQREALRNLLDTQKTVSKPSLSHDQLRANQYRMEEALHQREVVRIQYFEHGARFDLYTRIQNIDLQNRKIITEDGALDADAIIEIV